MKNLRFSILMIVCMLFTLSAHADNYIDMEPLKLEVPEMKPELVAVEDYDLNFSENYTLSSETCPSSTNWRPDFDFFKSKTNSGVNEFKVMDDLTFVGVPLFIGGWIVKGDKAMFRVNDKNGKKNTQLLTDFKTGIDDYTQYFGPAVTVGLKLAGYEGRSDWPRLLASAAMSYGIMAAFVNGIKYTAKEMRPDGSSANSWPSGHTATSFVGATLLHKEYGLTRSPWFSVAGYGVATATGVMRVLNNRHWVSDVMSGAGIGIMSTEIGYALSDILFKGKGLLRNNLEVDSDDPSFFSISMGVGIGDKDIEFNAISDLNDPELHGLTEEDINILKNLEGINLDIDFRSSTVVDAEGAYFFNKYVGVGGRFRVRAMSAKSFGQYSDISSEENIYFIRYALQDFYIKSQVPIAQHDFENGVANSITSMSGIIKSDHLAEFTASLGLYFNLPLNDHFALGTKLLVGRSFCQELDIDGHAEGEVKDISYDMTIKNGECAGFSVKAPVSTGETYTDDWSYLTLGANNSTSWGTGLSLTYRYKSNFSWKLFVDYDRSEKTFTMTYDPYHYLKKALTPSAYSLMSNRLAAKYLLDNLQTSLPIAYDMDPYVYTKSKFMNYITLGLSFAVNF